MSLALPRKDISVKDMVLSIMFSERDKDGYYYIPEVSKEHE